MKQKKIVLIECPLNNLLHWLVDRKIVTDSAWEERLEEIQRTIQQSLVDLSRRIREKRQEKEIEKEETGQGRRYSDETFGRVEGNIDPGDTGDIGAYQEIVQQYLLYEYESTSSEEERKEKGRNQLPSSTSTLFEDSVERYLISNSRKKEKGNILKNIDYFQCEEIMNILIANEERKGCKLKTIFGIYRNPFLKAWNNLLNGYRKDNIYLASSALTLVSLGLYLLPSLKELLITNDKILNDLQKRIEDIKRREGLNRKGFDKLCREYLIEMEAITSEDNQIKSKPMEVEVENECQPKVKRKQKLIPSRQQIRKKILETTKDINSLYDKIILSLQDQNVILAIQYYYSFLYCKMLGGESGKEKEEETSIEKRQKFFSTTTGFSTISRDNSTGDRDTSHINQVSGKTNANVANNTGEELKEQEILYSQEQEKTRARMTCIENLFLPTLRRFIVLVNPQISILFHDPNLEGKNRKEKEIYQHTEKENPHLYSHSSSQRSKDFLSSHDSRISLINNLMELQSFLKVRRYECSQEMNILLMSSNSFSNCYYYQTTNTTTTTETTTVIQEINASPPVFTESPSFIGNLLKVIDFSLTLLQDKYLQHLILIRDPSNMNTFEDGKAKEKGKEDDNNNYHREEYEEEVDDPEEEEDTNLDSKYLQRILFRFEAVSLLEKRLQLSLLDSQEKKTHYLRIQKETNQKYLQLSHKARKTKQIIEELTANFINCSTTHESRQFVITGIDS